MESVGRASAAIALGDFVLDVQNGALRRSDGRSVPLSAPAFEVLRVLVERRPRAVSKVELWHRLWPEATATPSQLADVVAELRAALGDDEGAPRVRTIHRYGYALREPIPADDEATLPQGVWRLDWIGGGAMLDDGEHILGRAGNPVFLATCPAVSRSHARIVVEQGRAAIEDLESRNGTWVNGQRITRATPLSDGDTVRIGSVWLKVSISPRPEAMEGLPAAS